MIGRSPETFTVAEAMALAGMWAAFEVYTPETTPVRVIEAVGETPDECLAQLAGRGADLSKYELVRLKRPY